MNSLEVVRRTRFEISKNDAVSDYRYGKEPRGRGRHVPPLCTYRRFFSDLAGSTRSPASVHVLISHRHGGFPDGWGGSTGLPHQAPDAGENLQQQ
jgi:hypothetical protein